MADVLKYPLTPVPLPICHVDGSIRKTPKVALMRYLECKVSSLAPSKVDIKIIDASFFCIYMLIFLQHLVELHASCYPESWNLKGRLSILSLINGLLLQ